MHLNLTTKIEAKLACLEKVEYKIKICQKELNQILHDLSNETKSSAGDKYEVGRAMLQIEREKFGRQLQELEQLQALIKLISTEQNHERIQLGSLVQTSQFNYFISVSLGEIQLGDFSFYAISKQTPVAQELLGKVSGDHVSFRNSSFEIQQIK